MVNKDNKHVRHSDGGVKKGEVRDFREFLLERTAGTKQKEEIKFSAHAKERMFSRDIVLSRAEMEQFNEAVERASAKGAKETLVLQKGNAFVVNVKNKTVITAMDGDSVKDNIFTNIDSAVLI